MQNVSTKISEAMHHKIENVFNFAFMTHTGLSDNEVLQSRQQHGNNVLTPPQRESVWRLFLQKLADPIIIVLLVAVGLSVGISIINHINTGSAEYAEPIGIFFAVLLATGIGFWFEHDANKKFNLLNTVNDTVAVKVMRNGKVCEVPKSDIVVGDIVLLATGDEVPADGELLEATNLQIDESCLTGEPSAGKTTRSEDFSPEATYPSNWAMRGSNVLDGHGAMQVRRVGDATEYGKVATKATEPTKTVTPLQQQLNKLAKFIGIVGITIAVLMFVLLVAKDIFWQGNVYANLGWLEIAQRLLNYLMITVTLVVVTVPEGLPMSVTLSLALSMRKMLKVNNLVRKIHACETMGATTVICTDKTGTLTQNQMRVHQVNFYGWNAAQTLNEDAASRFISEGIAVNSTAHLDVSNPAKVSTIGNPTEAALLLWLHAQGVNYAEQRSQNVVIQQLTFSTERKFMATWVQSAAFGKKILYLKGAPEIILSHCCSVQGEQNVSLATHLSAIEKQLQTYQQQAMRTLGFAYKWVDAADSTPIQSLMDNGFTFVGMAAIADPVRKDVPAAVATCTNAGIDVKIVTGDTAATATEIARQIGIWQPQSTERNIIAGVDFAELSDSEAAARVQELKVMCRARPSDKQRLVELLQQAGEVVAVTGDGTNDAPALNHAQVGLSMGSGTAVAKEASDITLLDDSFNSICSAVMWGRSVYQNIQRFILFQLTINLAALLVVFLGSLLGFELPLTVTQMLWVNLIMDTFAAGALASLPPNPKVMNVPPRKNSDFIITPAMRNSIVSTALVFVALLIAMLFAFKSDEVLSQMFPYIADSGRIAYSLSFFFTFFVMLQFWNLLNAKAFLSGRSVFVGLSNSKGLLLVVAVILIGQFCIVQWGGSVFRTVPLLWQDWIKIIAGTSLVMWVGEVARFIKSKR